MGEEWEEAEEEYEAYDDDEEEEKQEDEEETEEEEDEGRTRKSFQQKVIRMTCSRKSHQNHDFLIKNIIRITTFSSKSPKKNYFFI